MTINTEKIYHTLPVMLQNIGISMFGYYYYNRRFGKCFKNELQACKERAYFTSAEWNKWQENELRSILVHAFNTVPYYREKFSELGINFDQLKNFSINNIASLPLLEKITFRLLCDSKMMSEKPGIKSTYLYTSGSTGTPLKIRYSLNMQQKYAAIYENYVRNWAGVNYLMPRGVIGGRRILKEGISRGPYYRYNWVEKQTYFSAYHISKQTVSDYIKGIAQNKVEYLEGYSSSIHFLARFIEESGLKPPALKAVLGSTDPLTPEMRATISRVFQCEVFDSYNGVDVCNLISECEHHRLHIIPEAGIVEVLNENGEPCKPGEIGELVSTGLLNYDQPLIRYRIGDLVKLSKDQSCPCGRSMTVVDEIVGRVEDVVIGPDGREMRRFNRILIDISSVIEGQIIQNDYTKFTILIVAVKTPQSQELETIKQRMYAQLGPVEIDIQIVPSIPRGPNGKFKAVISHVSRNQAR